MMMIEDNWILSRQIKLHQRLAKKILIKFGFWEKIFNYLLKTKYATQSWAFSFEGKIDSKQF